MQPFPILKNDLTYDRINAETEIYGVIGDPIEQTLSPIVHNAAFRHLGLNKVMVPFLVPDGQLPEFFQELMWLDVKGCSVTIPHKEAIVPLLQQKENAVERTGTCNTVVLQAEGRRVGYNTDYRAAMDSLEQAMGGRVSEEDSSPLFEKHVMLLGAGGVARSIAFGLARRGANITITNRHDERATRLAEEVGCRGDHLGGPLEHPGGRGHQLHPGRDASQRGRHADATGGLQQGRHDRLRHDLPPREHDAAQAGPRAGVPRASRAWTCSSARRRSSSSFIRGKTRRWT